MINYLCEVGVFNIHISDTDPGYTVGGMFLLHGDTLNSVTIVDNEIGSGFVPMPDNLAFTSLKMVLAPHSLSIKTLFFHLVH